MHIRSSVSRLVVATLVAATVAVPTAAAMPIRGRRYGRPKYALEQQDMHASTVHVPEGGSRDRRAEGSIPGSRTAPQKNGPSMPAPPPGLPTWPVDPEPIVPAQPDPVSATDGDGGTTGWPVALLIGPGPSRSSAGSA